MEFLDQEVLEKATPQELATYERMLVRDIALLSPLDYAEHINPKKTKRYPHSELLSRYSKALIDHALYDSGVGVPAVWTPDENDPDDGAWRHPDTGEEAHEILVVSMPPRHGKSWIITETVPAWYLTRNPDAKVIVTGFESNFAKMFGRKNREKIEEHPELGVSVNPNTRAADEWTIKGHEGGMNTAGSGGPITGRGCSLAIVDDPVKNSEDALSEASRKKNKDWWESTMKSRIEFGGVAIVIQCLAGDQRVQMADGTWKPIASVQAGDEVMAYLDGKIVKRRVLKSSKSGTDQTYKVTTNRLSLVGNARHPVLGRDGKWHQIQDLHVGDYLLSPLETPTENVAIPVSGWDTLERAWLLGFLFGDGWVTSWERNNYDKKRDKVYKSRSWAVCAAIGVREEQNSRVRAGITEAFGRAPKETKFRYYRLDSNRAGRDLETLGLVAGKGAKEKRIPSWVYGQSSEYQQAFLKGLVEADGHKVGNHWVLGLANPDLVEDARLLGLNCGVRPTILRQYQSRAHPPNSPEPVDYIHASTNLTFPAKDSTRTRLEAPDGFRVERVSSIEIDEVQDVYDLTIQEAESFCVEGLVSHNTRWHEDDLAGYILENERCYKLNLPAIAFDATDDEGFSVDPDTGERDLLNRKPGEVLCPELFTKSKLLRIKEGKETDSEDGGPGGALWFSALWQGKPSIEGGGIIPKPYHYFTVEQNFSGRTFYKTESNESYANECIYFVTADLAVSTKTTADYTVFSLFAWTPHQELLLVDMFRQRIESTEHEREAEKFWRAAKERAGGAGVRFFGVENKTFGLSLIQSLRRSLRVPVRPLEADVDKTARAIPVGMYCREAKLFLRKDLADLADLEHEMQAFPNGKHDDMVDTLGYAVREAEHLPKTNPHSRDRRKKRKHHPVVGRWT